MAAVDEADLVMAAATAWDLDPDELFGSCDLRALAAIAADADMARTPVEAAAAVLVGVASRRPFGRIDAEHEVVAWLAALHVLTCSGMELRVGRSTFRGLVDELGIDPLTVDAVASKLSPHVRRRAGRLRRALRRAMRPRQMPLRTWGCPTCGHPVETTPADADALIWLGSSNAEPVLAARCSRQRGTHSPRGSSLVPPRAGADTAIPDELPVVTAPRDPGAFVALAPAGAVAFLPASAPDPAHYDVVLLGEPGPSTLCGDWGRLSREPGPTATVPASAIRLDDRSGRLDVRHLGREDPTVAALLHEDARRSA